MERIKVSSELVEPAVTDDSALHRRQDEAILRAIAEADAGEFATEAEVRAAIAELRR